MSFAHSFIVLISAMFALAYVIDFRKQVKAASVVGVVANLLGVAAMTWLVWRAW